jgi:hypothetical protein
MDIDHAPAALQKRLGPDGMAGLGELFIDARKEWTADVIGIVTDRFERRLTDVQPWRTVHGIVERQ